MGLLAKRVSRSLNVTFVFHSKHNKFLQVKNWKHNVPWNLTSHTFFEYCLSLIQNKFSGLCWAANLQWNDNRLSLHILSQLKLMDLPDCIVCIAILLQYYCSNARFVTVFYAFYGKVVGALSSSDQICLHL